MAIVLVQNNRPSVVNLPAKGRFKPRLLPGTNELDAEYWDWCLKDSKGRPSPTKRMLVDTGIIKVVGRPEPAPVMNPHHVDPSAPSPDALHMYSDEEAIAYINAENDPTKLMHWGEETELRTEERRDVLEALVARIQALGIRPE